MGQLLIWTIKDIIECINQMQEIEFDCIICIEGKRGLGKCQVKGNKVLMHDGSWKKVENIKVGDKVISPQKDGSFVIATVTDTHSRFENKIYEIKEVTRNKRVLYKCSFNHIIPVWKTDLIRIKGDWKKRRFERKLMHLTAESISKRYTKQSHYVAFTTPLIDFNNVDPKIDAYSLGSHLGDGSFTKALSITTKDLEIIDSIKNAYPLDFLKKYQKKDNLASSYRFSILGKFAKQLEKLGLRYKLSGTKFIPKKCLTSSVEFRLNLLAGLIDTDGYVSKIKNNHISITTKSPKLAQGIKNLVYSLGGYSNIRKIKKGCQNGFVGEYFEVKISFENPTIIPLRTWKKERLGKKFTHNPRHVAIESVKSNPDYVFGFEIDSPSQWYITDNWLVTHNSTLAYKIAQRVKSPFNPRKDICYSRKNTIKGLATKIKGVIFSDEMINVAFNRDFYQEDQKKLVKGLNMYRDSCNLYLFCIKKFTALDTQLRDLIKIRIVIQRRGLALIHMQVTSDYSNDPWDIKNNAKIEAKWNLKGGKPKYGQLTTCKGILHFNDLTPKQKAEYKAIKKEKRGKVFNDESEMELSPEQVFYKNLLKQVNTKTLTKKEFIKICLVGGKKYRTVRIRINEMLRETGANERLNALLIHNNVVGKKDVLGFNNKAKDV